MAGSYSTFKRNHKHSALKIFFNPDIYHLNFRFKDLILRKINLTAMVVSEKDNSFYSEKRLKKTQLELLQWKDLLTYNSDEISFLKLFLNAEIFKPGIPNLFENLKEYLNNLDDIKSQNFRFFDLIEKNLKTVKDAIENDKAPPENFNSDFENIRIDIEKYFEKFYDLKLEIFHYTGKLLKQNE